MLIEKGTDTEYIRNKFYDLIQDARANNKKWSRVGDYIDIPSFEEHPYKSFSVVISNWERSVYVPYIIDQILNQDYPKDLIEIVIVDQNSHNQEKLQKVCSEIAKLHKDIKFRYIQHKEDPTKNPRVRRNTGIIYSSNEFVLMLESDILPLGKDYLKQLSWIFHCNRNTLIFPLNIGTPSITKITKTEKLSQIGRSYISSSVEDWLPYILTNDRLEFKTSERADHDFGASFPRKDALDSGLINENYKGWGGLENDFYGKLTKLDSTFFCPEIITIQLHDFPTELPSNLHIGDVKNHGLDKDPKEKGITHGMYEANLYKFNVKNALNDDFLRNKFRDIISSVKEGKGLTSGGGKHLNILPFEEHSYEDITVVVSNWERSVYVPYILQQIAGQDYPRDLLEIIVVDQNSYDKERLQKICRNFSESNPDINIKYFQHFEDPLNNPRVRRNTGIINASNRFIVMVESDTILLGSTFLKNVSWIFHCNENSLIVPTVVRSSSIGKSNCDGTSIKNKKFNSFLDERVSNMWGYVDEPTEDWFPNILDLDDFTFEGRTDHDLCASFPKEMAIRSGLIKENHRGYGGLEVDFYNSMRSNGIKFHFTTDLIAVQLHNFPSYLPEGVRLGGDGRIIEKLPKEKGKTFGMKEIDMKSKSKKSYIEPMFHQNIDEIEALCDNSIAQQGFEEIKDFYKEFLVSIGGDIFLEIGVYKGGSSKIWEYCGFKYGIGIDPFDKREVYCDNYDMVVGSSLDSSTIEEVKKLLGRRKIDFLFIDGSHNPKDVRKDFENYSSFVKKGGIIAFHDIYLSNENGKAVRVLFDDVAHGYKYFGKIHRDHYGIGVIKNIKITRDEPTNQSDEFHPYGLIDSRTLVLKSTDDLLSMPKKSMWNNYDCVIVEEDVLESVPENRMISHFMRNLIKIGTRDLVLMFKVNSNNEPLINKLSSLGSFSNNFKFDYKDKYYHVFRRIA